MDSLKPMSNEELLALAQDRINDLPPGQYEVSTIFGELYEAAVRDPKNFGKIFKKAVLNRQLTGIFYSHMDTGSKHLIYKIG